MSHEQWALWFWLAVTVGGLASAGYILMKALRYLARWVAQRASRSKMLDPAAHAWIEELSRGMRLAVVSLIGVLMIFFMLRVVGRPVPQWDASALIDLAVARGLRVILLLAGAYVAVKVGHFFVAQLGILIRPTDDTPAALLERDKRAQTINAILRNFTTTVVCLVTGLMLLHEIGVDTTPILTSLGVVGVALGFGAQQVVGDLLAGFFNIFENQIRVGDVAVINGTSGQVQEIRLRTTILRGLDGTVHVFRNGAINSLSNMTKDFSYFVMDLGVSYGENADRISAIIREVGKEMQADPALGPWILEPVEILGIDNFGESAMTIKLRIKTLPIKQWDVGREFRRRLKSHFDAKGIQMPPHQTVHFVEAPAGVRGPDASSAAPVPPQPK